MKKITSLVVVTSLFFVSCASKFTPEQQTQLSSLKVAQPTYGENAYQAPIGHADMNVNDATMAAGGGLIGALIGQLVVGGVTAGQNAGYNKKYGDSSAQAQSSIPTNLANTLENKSESALNAIPQLSGKIKDASGNILKTQITSYGYKRTGKTDSKILMTPYINGSTSLSMNGVEVMKSTPISGQTYEANSGGNEITTYVSNKSLAASDFTRACEIFAQNLQSAVQAKY